MSAAATLDRARAQQERAAYEPFLRAAEQQVDTARARLRAANATAETNPSPAALVTVDIADYELRIAAVRYRALVEKYLSLTRRNPRH